MTRLSFEQRYRPAWERLTRLVEATAPRSGRGRGATYLQLFGELDAGEFDRLYRELCQHLALAQQRMYGADLVDQLNDLALRAHQQLYARRVGDPSRLVRFLAVGFPALVRSRWRAVLLAAALLVLPALGVGFATWGDPGLIFALYSPEELRQLEQMYDPAGNYRPLERQSDSNLMMFGFYLWNNVSVAFRTFAGGILFGLGSLFFLALNGANLGAIAAHLQREGLGHHFCAFVVGHSGPELTAIALAGAAGLNLAFALLAPGRLLRVEALRRAALDSVRLVAGAALLLLCAAFVEAFWSARVGTPDRIKYLVGAMLWLATWAYLLLAGGRDGS